MKKADSYKFQRDLKNIEKEVDPKTWKLIDPLIQKIIALVFLNDTEYNSDSKADMLNKKQFIPLGAYESKDIQLIVNKILAGESIRSVLTESQLKEFYLEESRKFVVGDTFVYTDKYGEGHECKVLFRNDFDEMDSDDYAIGEITYSYPTMGSPKKLTVRIYKSEQRDSYGDEYFVSDRKNGIANWVFPNRK